MGDFMGGKELLWKCLHMGNQMPGDKVALSSNGFLLPFLDIDFFHFFGVISPRILCLFPMKTDFLGFFSICKIWCLQDQAWIRWSKLVNGVPCAKQLISLESELSNAQCTKIFDYEDRRVSLLCQNRDARERFQSKFSNHWMF